MPQVKRRTPVWVVVAKAPSRDWCVVCPTSVVNAEPVEVYRTRREARGARFKGERVVRAFLQWTEPMGSVKGRE